MSLFPSNLPPTPPQREIRTIIIGAGLLFGLIIVVTFLWSGHRNDPYPITKEYYIKAQQDEVWVEKLIGDPVALFTLILTGAIVGLYIATRSLWVATDRLVRGAEDTSKRQLRAYLSITRAKMVFVQPNRPFVKFRIKNNGQTPAYGLVCFVGFDIRPYPRILPLNYTKENVDTWAVVLGPKNSLAVEANCPVVLPDEWLPIFGTREMTAYVYGEVFYSDAFGEKHTLRFSGIYGGEEPALTRKDKKGRTIGGLSLEGEGNEAD